MKILKVEKVVKENDDYLEVRVEDDGVEDGLFLSNADYWLTKVDGVERFKTKLLEHRALVKKNNLLNAEKGEFVVEKTDLTVFKDKTI